MKQITENSDSASSPAPLDQSEAAAAALQSEQVFSTEIELFVFWSAPQEFLIYQ